MKKIILSLVVLFSFVAFSHAQTEQGMKVVEINTAFGDNITGAPIGSTGIMFASSDGTSVYNIGAEGGYFLADNIAIKLGLGLGGVSYDGGDSDSAFGYKIGTKYYIAGVAPFELSLNGSSIKDNDINPLWVGLQGGYAIFLADNVALEPGLRYNISLNNDYTDKGVFQGNMGFSMFF